MGGPVNLPGWVLSIPASLVLHAVPLLLLMRLFNPSLPQVFVVDLSEPRETARVTAPSESARRPTAPLVKPKSSAPRASRAERPSPPAARDETRAEPAPPAAPYPVPALTPEPSPSPAAAPMPQVTEPLRTPAPARDIVGAVSPAETVEREAPAPTSTARVAPGAADGSEGKAAATTSSEGTGAGMSTDAEYRAYLGLVRQRILEALRYPPAARRQGLTGTVYLEIVVQPTGTISEARIVSTSSHPILDQAALETVRRLPSIGFPPGLTPRQLHARLPVVFNLR